MWPASLVLSVPLVIAAGIYTGVLGILVVMAAPVVLTRIWLDYSRR